VANQNKVKSLILFCRFYGRVRNRNVSHRNPLWINRYIHDPETKRYICTVRTPVTMSVQIKSFFFIALYS